MIIPIADHNTSPLHLHLRKGPARTTCIFVVPPPKLHAPYEYAIAVINPGPSRAIDTLELCMRMLETGGRVSWKEDRQLLEPASASLADPMRNGWGKREVGKEDRNEKDEKGVHQRYQISIGQCFGKNNQKDPFACSHWRRGNRERKE